MEKIVALAKRRGFIYQGSEIYEGITGFWDYGPLGVEFKNNLKREWWKYMVYDRENIVGIDAAIIMNPKVWEASGHLKAFTDPLVECKKCNKRFRKDKFDEYWEDFYKKVGRGGVKALSKQYEDIYYCIDRKNPHKEEDLTQEKKFNLMTEVFLGVTEPKQKTYLRGEITQGVFVNFKNIVDSSRVKIPFGIAQIGKAFRNEITPGNFTYRSREFEQMELEFFIKPNEKEGEKWFSFWKEERMKWYKLLGIKSENLRFRNHEQDERAHYARFATDIEYKSPFGWSEFEGIHHRGDFDLTNHNLKYKDPEIEEEYTPWVIETSGGVDRAMLFFLVDAYHEEEKRIVLKLHPKLAPVKVAVFPLVRNKKDIVSKAKSVYKMLKAHFVTAFDDRGNIGKRYLAQDEIGTPFCVTIDYETLGKQTVTIRDRDTMKQERVNIDKLEDYIKEKLI